MPRAPPVDVVAPRPPPCDAVANPDGMPVVCAVVVLEPAAPCGKRRVATHEQEASVASAQLKGCVPQRYAAAYCRWQSLATH
jgi:hypothetical protein